MNRQFLLGVMGVLRDDRDRVLLFHHTYREPAWALPAGWMIQGESPLQAIEREVLEESGLIARADRLLLVGTISDRPMLEFVVGAHIIGGEFRPSTEVDEAGWWPMDEVPGTAWLKSILARVSCLAPGEVGQYRITWAFNH
jgi:8-oxo-dGTP diphosphatase